MALAEGAVAARQAMREAHALVVGVSDYVHAEPLPAAVREGARQLAALLADPDGGGYPDPQVRLLLDGAASAEAIREELKMLAALTGPESTVLIYFAGHGGRARGESGEVHLFATETDDRSREALAATAISGDELAAAVAALAAPRILIVFDCCHAAGVGGGGRSLVGLPESWCRSLGASGGRVVIAAARGDEYSWLTADDEPSLFSRQLLAAFARVGGHDGLVRAWDLFEYVQPRVTTERRDQHPVFQAEMEENFAVALSLGGRVTAAAPEREYDAYLSYADRAADAAFVWQTLVPRLESAGLGIAVSGDVEEPGVFRVVAAERGIARARRTVVVLSDAYLEDEMTAFIDALAQSVGLEEGTTRLLPVRFSAFDEKRLPARLRMLVSLDLAHPQRGARNFNRLVRALQPDAERPEWRS